MPDSNPEHDGRQIALPPPHAAIPADQAAVVAQNISRALKRAANKSRAPVSIVTGGAYMSRPGDRLLRLGIIASFAIVVILPLLAASIYWALIAGKQYVTEAKFALQTSDGPSFEALGVSTQDNRQIQDSQVVVRYILSRAMVDELDKSINLRGKFSQADYLSRFDPVDPIEKLEK
jgi:capsular polysaccharide transport system permease protein